MSYFCAVCLAGTCLVQTDVASVQRRLADYYDGITSIHVVYEMKRSRTPVRPTNAAVGKVWDEYVDDAHIERVHELWWRYPSQRLDMRTKNPKKEIPVTDSRCILHNGLSVRHDHHRRSAVESQTVHREPFEYTPVWFLGRCLSGTLNTSLADLLAVPGAARVMSEGELKGMDAAFGIAVGPRIAPAHCPPHLKGGMCRLFFEDAMAALPSKIEWTNAFDINQKGIEEAPIGPETHWVMMHLLADVRPVPTGPGTTKLFPFKMVTHGPGTVGTWNILKCELNMPIPDSIFTGYKQEAESISVYGQRPKPRKEAMPEKTRVQKQANRVREAEELLGVNSSPVAPPTRSFGWMWFAGLSLLGLSVGILALTRQRRTQ